MRFLPTFFQVFFLIFIKILSEIPSYKFFHPRVWFRNSSQYCFGFFFQILLNISSKIFFQILSGIPLGIYTDISAVNPSGISAGTLLRIAPAIAFELLPRFNQGSLPGYSRIFSRCLQYCFEDPVNASSIFKRMPLDFQPGITPRFLRISNGVFRELSRTLIPELLKEFLPRLLHEFSRDVFFVIYSADSLRNFSRVSSWEESFEKSAEIIS